MSKSLALFVVFLTCVVVCGCGTQTVEEISSTDSVPTSPDAPAQADVPQDSAPQDRLSEWVVTDDTVAQPPSAEETPDVSVASDAEGAEAVVDSVDDLDQGSSIDKYVSQIEDLLGAGDMAAAVKLAQEAHSELNGDPVTVRLLVELSARMARKRDLDGALTVLEELQETSDDQNIPILLFQIYHQKSQQAEDDAAALALIQKSTAILRGLNISQPALADLFFQEAVLLSKNQQSEQAATVLREAFEKGFSQISVAEEEEAFASNEAVTQVIQEFAVAIRAQLREEVRAEIEGSESFPFGFELTSVAGEPVSIEELKGKVVIVDLWGTWCPPCRKEIPHFLKLLENHGDDLAIIGVNFENAETEEEKASLVSSFLADNGVTYPCVLATDALESQIPDIEGFPTTIFLDRDGTVRLKVVGYHPYDKLEAIVRELMGDEPAA